MVVCVCVSVWGGWLCVFVCLCEVDGFVCVCVSVWGDRCVFPTFILRTHIKRFSRK